MGLRSSEPEQRGTTSIGCLQRRLMTTHNVLFLLKHMQPIKYTKLRVGVGQRHSENRTPHPLFVYKICWPFSLKTLKINDKNDLLKLSAYLVCFFFVFSEKQPCSDMVRYFCCLLLCIEALYTSIQRFDNHKPSFCEYKYHHSCNFLQPSDCLVEVFQSTSTEDSDQGVCSESSLSCLPTGPFPTLRSTYIFFIFSCEWLTLPIAPRYTKLCQSYRYAPIS